MTQRPNDSMTTSSSLGPHLLFADVCVGLLNQGQSVRFKATGWSMQPTICDGEMINVEPVLPSQVRHGDIILYRNPRGITAHRVIHIQRERNSALSPQPSVKLSGHWVIRLLGHFWVSLSPNSQRRTPNVSNHRSIAPCPMRHALCVSFDCPSTLDPRHSSLIFYTRGDSLTADDFPVMSDQILGKVFSVERNGRAVALYGNRAIIIQETRLFLFTLKRCVVHALSQIKGLLFRCKVSLKANTIHAK
jgi:hypothetical protein